MRVNIEVIARALAAHTLDEAIAVQDLIASAVGTRHERPLGDTWGNMGLITGGGGSYDYKALENVTNMQDAVLELHAMLRYGSLDDVPYATPLEAAADLFDGLAYEDVAKFAKVEFYESDPPARDTHRLTMVFRDHGCGITSAYAARSILALGSNHKNELAWAQGAFGLGGRTTYRNAKAVIMVMRRDPRLLRIDEDDRISVAVLEWVSSGKKDTALYLVTTPWYAPGDEAEPYSIESREFPAFDPGTHLALISYHVEGFHRTRGGDERTFDTVLDTRLFQPVTPVRFTNSTEGGRSRNENLRGLRRRLDENPDPSRPDGCEALPFTVRGQTFSLRVRFVVFASPRDEVGSRRRFVAKDHCVVFISNGQVHHHWTPQEFRYRTENLGKLYDRLLVVVDTDALPIEIRTGLFTADRTATVRTEEAVKLEEEVAGFLDEWDELREINGRLVREALRHVDDEHSTVNLARQIGRAFRDLGVSFGGGGGGGGGRGRRGRPPQKPAHLYGDPTHFFGWDSVELIVDRTGFLTYSLNAVNGFIPERAQLTVTSDHPAITPQEITVGDLRGGRIRVSVAVPDNAVPGSFTLTARIADWLTSTGGLGPILDWTTELEVATERTSPVSGDRGGPGTANRKPSGGDLVPVFWSSTDVVDGWTNKVAGDVEEMAASDVATKKGYEELAELGDAKILALSLNNDFAPFKKYIQARTGDTSETGINAARDRYAVGVGTGMALLNRDIKKRRDRGELVSDEVVREATEAIARGVLAIMPQYDQLAQMTGIEKGVDG